MSESDTPITDAAVCWSDGHTFAYVNVGDCRQLERKLSQAKADLASVLDTDGAIKTLRTELHKQDDRVQELKRDNARLAKEVATLTLQHEDVKSKLVAAEQAGGSTVKAWVLRGVEIKELQAKLATIGGEKEG